MAGVGCVLGVDRKLLQEVNRATARRNDVVTLLGLFTLPMPFYVLRRNAAVGRAVTHLPAALPGGHPPGVGLPRLPGLRQLAPSRRSLGLA
jgi:hypothetical protein